MPSFPEKITSRKDIVNGSFLDFFGTHVSSYVFPRIMILVNCFGELF